MATERGHHPGLPGDPGVDTVEPGAVTRRTSTSSPDEEYAGGLPQVGVDLLGLDQGQPPRVAEVFEHRGMHQ